MLELPFYPRCLLASSPFPFRVVPKGCCDLAILFNRLFPPLFSSLFRESTREIPAMYRENEDRRKDIYAMSKIKSQRRSRRICSVCCTLRFSQNNSNTLCDQTRYFFLRFFCRRFFTNPGHLRILISKQLSDKDRLNI